MLIASLLEPKKATIGDYWYCLATKELHEAVHVSSLIWQWLGVPRGYFDSPRPPGLNPVTLTIPTIWIMTNDPNRIPHIYDVGLAMWIPVIPPGYTFPPQYPVVGDCWHDTLSGFDFVYNIGGWQMAMMGASGGAPANVLPVVCWHCFTSNSIVHGRCVNCGNYSTVPAPGIAAPPAPPQLSPHGNINLGNITSGGIGHLQFNAVGSQALLTLSANQSALKIANLVEIFADGRIVYYPSYTPDKAAEALWEAIAQMSPIYKENVKIKQLEDNCNNLMNTIQKYHDAGFKLPEPKLPADPNAAWNAAMGVII